LKVGTRWELKWIFSSNKLTIGKHKGTLKNGLHTYFHCFSHLFKHNIFLFFIIWKGSEELQGGVQDEEESGDTNMLTK
jgi:hypothetical protein